MKIPVAVRPLLSDVVCFTTKNTKNAKSIFLQHYHSAGAHAVLASISKMTACVIDNLL